jgi:methylated-DNA-[protein]-cysteine S-methyltransferase
MEKLMNYRYMDSPIGALLLAEQQGALCVIGFPSGKGRVMPEPDWTQQNDCCEEAVVQLQEYFAGARTVFDLTLAPTGTAFQLKVLDALLAIPFGETRSYADIATKIGRPKAVRAVGTANGRNPLPIVIPCHRVIGTNGSLTGFGGGLDTKAFLLNLEGVQGHQSSLFD